MGKHHRVKSEEEMKDDKEDDKDILSHLKAESLSPLDSGDEKFTDESVPPANRGCGRRKSSNTSQDDESPPRY